MITPCQKYTGITEMPKGNLRRFLDQKKKSTGVRWGYDEETTTEKIDKRLCWRFRESRAYRHMPIVTTDEKLGVRCKAPIILEKDQTDYFELAPHWSIRNREGKWSEYALYINPHLKRRFEANMAARENEERMEYEREVERARFAERLEAERVALDRMARQRVLQKKAEERLEAERVALDRMEKHNTAPSSVVACPSCTFHNPRGSRFCEICNKSLA